MKLQVDMSWNGVEVSELLNDSLLGNKTLVNKPSNGTHGEPSVLNFTQLVTGLGGGILGETKRIETEVSWSAVTFQSGDQGHGTENLQKASPKQNLRHGPGLNKEVMRFAGSHCWNTRKSNELRNDETEDSEHGNAACVIGK